MSGTRVVVYAAVGKSLRTFALDAETGALQLRQTVDDLVNDCHYVAVHPNGRVLYAAQSESPPPRDRPLISAISAFAIDAGTGTLSRLGDSFDPPLKRAVHVSVDRAGRFLFMAHNFTESVSVLRLQPDGRLGEPVTPAPEQQGLGFLVHQIRVDPSNRWVFVPVRGDDPPSSKPGKLVVFDLRDDGVLVRRHVVEYPPLLGPRHVDFHPTLPLVYLAVERGNRLFTYGHDSGVLTERFASNTLENPAFTFPDQRAGAVSVHPGGRFLYITNRNVNGGENSVAAFALHPNSGEPTHLQHLSSHGFEPRTMAFDPTGRFLIVANQKPVTGVTPNLSVFALADDGRLTFLRSHDQPADAWWVGAVALSS